MFGQRLAREISRLGMKQIELRFYAELNDFLSQEKRSISFSRPLYGRTSVKDIIEALGVPHSEVDLILVNGQSVDFTYRVREEDRISVYPIFQSIDISSITRVRPLPLTEYQFLLDVHLNRLAVYLRFLGFDTDLDPSYDDVRLASISEKTNRVLLTRDIGLLKRGVVSYGYWVRETNPKKQLIEILNRFDLNRSIRPFTRCTCCNSLLNLVEKEAISHLLFEKTKEIYHEFYLCSGCGRIYWKGSHYKNMEKWLYRAIYENAITS